MKSVILAGGLGTRLMEETVVRPKPMVEVGGLPILWHIMQLYARQGFGDFVVAAGYKSDWIKRYFIDYHLLNSNLRIDMATDQVEVRNHSDIDWSVKVVDTGDETLTGGRLLRLAPLLSGEGTFMATYGDGLCDVDLEALLEFHRSHGRIATLTAVQPATTKYLSVEEGRVATLDQEESGWCNGGFFIFETRLFNYIDSDYETLEEGALTRLARDGELMAYKHGGFWQCMDTVKERRLLENLWASGKAPWALPVTSRLTARSF